MVGTGLAGGPAPAGGDRRRPVLRISVAIHIEPYQRPHRRSVVGDIGHLHALGITTFYVYQAFDDPARRMGPGERSRCARKGDDVRARPRSPARRPPGTSRGLYTYDIVTYGGGKLARLCDAGAMASGCCAPRRSGPGTTPDGRRVTRTSSPVGTG